MQSELQKILIGIQTSLNAVTLHSVNTNRTLSTVIATYDANTTVDASKAGSEFVKALLLLADAMESFMNGAERLERYVNEQG